MRISFDDDFLEPLIQEITMGFAVEDYLAALEELGALDELGENPTLPELAAKFDEILRELVGAMFAEQLGDFRAEGRLDLAFRELGAQHLVAAPQRSTPLSDDLAFPLSPNESGDLLSVLIDYYMVQWPPLEEQLPVESEKSSDL